MYKVHYKELYDGYPLIVKQLFCIYEYKDRHYCNNGEQFASYVSVKLSNNSVLWSLHFQIICFLPKMIMYQLNFNTIHIERETKYYDHMVL
jgi:hypothetical protein